MDAADRIVGVKAGHPFERRPAIARIDESEVQRFADRRPAAHRQHGLELLQPGETGSELLDEVHGRALLVSTVVTLICIRERNLDLQGAMTSACHPTIFAV